MKTKSLILFDLDGTLVDSVPDLIWCVQQMLSTLDLPPRSEEALQNYVGNGASVLIKRALTGHMDGEPDPALHEQAMSTFLILYGDNICQFSTLYPGVLDTLKRLQNAGKTLACITNKPGQFTAPLLEALDIYSYFELVLGGDALPKMKPDPMPLLHAVEKFSTSVDNTIMVGDSRNDIEAARAAQVTSIAVSYGYNHGEDISLAKPDYVIDHFAEVAVLTGS